MLAQIPDEYSRAAADLAWRTIARAVAALPGNKTDPHDSSLATFHRRASVARVAANLSSLLRRADVDPEQRADALATRLLLLQALMDAGLDIEATDFASDAMGDALSSLGAEHEITLGIRHFLAIGKRLTGRLGEAVRLPSENLGAALALLGSRRSAHPAVSGLRGRGFSAAITPWRLRSHCSCRNCTWHGKCVSTSSAGPHLSQPQPSPSRSKS